MLGINCIGIIAIIIVGTRQCRVPTTMPCPYNNAVSLRQLPITKIMWNKISLLIIATLPYFGLTFTAIAADKTVAKANHSPTDIIAQNLAQNSAEQEQIRIYEQASPAVVMIQTNRSSGSGFIVSSDGLIITNEHVLRGATSPVTITLANEQKVLADIVGFADNGFDLAAVKIRGASNLPTLPLASSGTVRVGQFAYAIGSPFGAEYRNSLTTGSVSRVDNRRGLIQHDAAINPGNSGWPLLNSQGQVIGVNTYLFNPQGTVNIGISLAIAIDQLQPFLVALNRGNAPRSSQRQQPRANNQAQSLPLTGQVISGRLDPGDHTLPDNSYYNYYKIYGFEGRAGQRVTIEMNSQEIDPTLFLLKPDGSKLAENDDISPSNPNARITVTLPATGVYLVLANAFEPGESGSYTIRATAQ